MSTFSELPLLPTLLQTLGEQQLTTPTEVQLRAIPKLLAGRTLVGIAQTGSGKTLAYALPVLDHVKRLELADDSVVDTGRPRAIVLVPGRELGEQVAKVFKTFTHDTRLRVRAVFGGVKARVNHETVRGEIDVLIATPGRLVQLVEKERIQLDDVRMLVLDEADQLLDLGFIPSIEKIIDACPPARQLALFSATIPGEVRSLINSRFSNPATIECKGTQQTVATLTTQNRKVIEDRRYDALRPLLREKIKGGTLIFTNTQEQCDALAALLKENGVRCVIYRGEMDPTERRANLKAFREGLVGVLVSTDLGGRGLDIDHVARVINYNLPRNMDNYLHRVGRTARAGREGLVINLVTPRDLPLMRKVDPRWVANAHLRAPSGPIETGPRHLQAAAHDNGPDLRPAPPQGRSNPASADRPPSSFGGQARARQQGAEGGSAPSAREPRSHGPSRRDGAPSDPPRGPARETQARPPRPRRPREADIAAERDASPRGRTKKR